MTWTLLLVVFRSPEARTDLLERQSQRQRAFSSAVLHSKQTHLHIKELLGFGDMCAPAKSAEENVSKTYTSIAAYVNASKVTVGLL